MMFVPGARISGLLNPSLVFPRAVKEATTSSVRLVLAFSSVAPTVMTKGSLAGEALAVL